MPKTQAFKRSWWRDHFHDHPGLSAGSPDAYTGQGQSMKPKVYCMKCFNSDIVAIEQRDQLEVAHGTRNEIRPRALVEAYLWTLELTKDGRGWIRCASPTPLNHLRRCKLQSDAVRDMAEESVAAGRGGGSPTRRAVNSETQNIMMAAAPSHPQFFPPNNPYPGFLGHGPGPSMASGSVAWHIHPPSDPDFQPPSPTLSQALSSASHNTDPFSGSAAPSDSGSSTHSNRRIHSRPPSLRRSVSRQPSLGEFWSVARQKEFETRITRLTVSAGLPLSWVDNPEWIDFCMVFIPSAKSPSRKVLTNRLLLRAVEEFRIEAKAAAKGHEATLQSDGWTGTNNHHLIAFMITVNGQVRTVRVHDASSERKTAEILVKHIEDVLKALHDEWAVKTVAIVTDASGECRKARRQLRLKYPAIVMLDCYAHQINLIVGDYFKSNAHILQYTDMATELITWLRSKTYVLALLRKVQEDAGSVAKAIIRAVLTRWTAHYLAYRRLLELRLALTSLVYSDETRGERNSNIITGAAGAKRKARDMIEIIKNPLFWYGIARMKHHLEPLATAANITQATICRIDEVLLTFGFLTMQYIKMTDAEDVDGCTAIMASIEQRWAKADQEIFIAAVILNPFYQSTPFAALPFLNNAGIHAILNQLWTRFYVTQPPHEFHSHVSEYLGHTGYFANLKSQCLIARVAADQERKSPDPLALYEQFSFPGRPYPPFILLARRILSICANSATCERLWSVFGNTLTKLRNRLTTTTLSALGELKMHIRDEHIRGQTRKRLKRVFGDRSPAPPLDTAATSSSISAAADTSSGTAIDPALEGDVHVPSLGTLDDVSTNPGGGGPFRSIAQNHIGMVDQDTEDQDVVVPPTTIGIPVTIRDLFDFSRSHWVDIYAQTARRSFDEELELYEMLDLDAEGEAEADVDVDDSTGDILVG